jgi:hypothetical protein
MGDAEEVFSVCPHCGYEANPDGDEPFDADLVIGRTMHVLMSATAKWPKNVSMRDFIAELEARVNTLNRRERDR